MSKCTITDKLTVWCLTVGLARTLAVPDSGIAADPSTSSILSEGIKKHKDFNPLEVFCLRDKFQFILVIQFLFREDKQWGKCKTQMKRYLANLKEQTHITADSGLSATLYSIYKYFSRSPYISKNAKKTHENVSLHWVHLYIVLLWGKISTFYSLQR